MYNTCFWALVLEGGLSVQDANKELSVSGKDHLTAQTD